VARGIAVSLTKQVGDKWRIICCTESQGMPDVLSSTKHPLHPAQFHISIGHHHGFLQRRGNPVKFAHISICVSGIFGSHGARLGMMNRVGNLT